LLFVGDDWAEDHHDVELMDAGGRRLAKARLPEGVVGIARLHAMIAEQLGGDTDEAEVLIGIETERGPWVSALVAAGYTVYAMNPLQVARYRERRSVSGAKSDAADAHTLADMVRTDAHQLRRLAVDSPKAQAIKVVARAHKTLIWDRTRHTLRLRQGLREYFPAALEAFDDLDAADTLALLGKAPDPVSAAKLTRGQIRAALKAARRRDVDTKTARIQTILRGEQLGRHAVITSAYAATTGSIVAVLGVLNEQITTLQGQVETHFGQHPDAEILLSQPGMGAIVGARVLAEFGDAAGRYLTAKARKNYAATSPITRASGKKKVVAARFVHNDRLIDALMLQAQSALQASPGARTYYDKQRARGLGHNPAQRQLANRLVGILHGCLKTRTLYDEATAWSHHNNQDQQTAA
jgi:transposase